MAVKPFFIGIPMKFTLIIAVFFIIIVYPVNAIAQSPTLPVGTIAMYSGSDNSSPSPDGWLMCNGGCVAQNDYPELYALIGDTYGTSCSGSEFQLPNFNGRFAVGSNGLNITHDFRLGKNGGSEFVTLAVDEMPTHEHFITLQFDDGVPGVDFNQSFFTQGTGGFIGADVTGVAGGGQQHENMPPYLAVGFMIKALPDTELPITSTYDIDIGFADSSNVSITRTLVTSMTETYTGNINLPAFYKSFDALYTIAMFMVFLLIGAAAGKPTLFVISFIGLYVTGVLQNGGNYVTYPLLILAASYLIYKFLIVRRKI